MVVGLVDQLCQEVQEVQVPAVVEVVAGEARRMENQARLGEEAEEGVVGTP